MIAEILQNGLREMRLAERVPAGAVPLLGRYAQLLLEKNQEMNLTAITEPEQVARLHMLDSAALLQYADFCGKTLIDVGTGAGFPGLPLKILVPELRVTLLDSLAKRVDWLTEICGTLTLSGVEAIHARAEEQARQEEFREQFDFATARAVADLRLLAELCLPFVKIGGTFLSMKAVDSGQELAAAEKAIATLGGQVSEVQDYAIPGTDIRHRLICIRKCRPTPAKYPRPFAKIKKAPL